MHDHDRNRAIAVEILAGLDPDIEIAEALERCDWSEVAIALRDAGHEAAWERLRAALLESDPDCDC